jgi:hypothetical protein
MDTLIAHGLIVDTIEEVVDLNGVETSPLALVLKVHATVTSGGSRSCLYLVDATWRTLIGDTPITVRDMSYRSQDFCGMYMEVVRQAIQGFSTLNKEHQRRLNISPFLESMYKAVTYGKASPHRRFFTTTTGLVGLGTPECEISDAVCILRGHRLPVIMRSCGDSFLSYSFLGSAYVHGIMKGEAVPDFNHVVSDIPFRII